MLMTTLDVLDALSRTRPLSEREVVRLALAVHRSSARREKWHWTAGEDRRLLSYLKRGKKPAQITFLLNRTERAIWRRMNRLGLSVRGCAPAKCSIARDGKK